MGAWGARCRARPTRFASSWRRDIIVGGFDSSPLLDKGCDPRTVLARHALGHGELPILANRRAKPHRHAELLGLLQAERHVLVHEFDAEILVVASRQHMFRIGDLRDPGPAGTIV